MTHHDLVGEASRKAFEERWEDERREEEELHRRVLSRLTTEGRGLTWRILCSACEETIIGPNIGTADRNWFKRYFNRISWEKKHDCEVEE